MKTGSLFACLFAAAAVATPTRAAGVDLAWDGCLGDPGALSLKTFTCDRNTGEDQLYVSFVPAVSFTGGTVFEVALDLRTRGGLPISLWWQDSIPDGCRADQFQADPVQPSGTPGCAGWLPPFPDFFTSRFNFRYPTPDAAHLVVSVHTQPVSISAGQYYFACRLLVRHPATVGAGACAGCLDPVDITVSAVRLAKPGFEELINTPLADNLARWQQEQATPARASTWSALKSLYH